MAAVRTSLTAADLPENLRDLRGRGEDTIPVGFTWHKRPVPAARVPGEGGWDSASRARRQSH